MDKLLKTVDFFDLVKNKYQLPSDYALAKKLGIYASLISMHRKKSFGMNDELAIRCADLLDYDPAFVLMCVNYERAKRADEKLAYSRLAGLAQAYSRELKMI